MATTPLHDPQAPPLAGATTETRTTQLGLAIVQTDVTVSGSRSGAKWVSRASAANTRWHKQALAAYQAFGSGSSR